MELGSVLEIGAYFVPEIACFRQGGGKGSLRQAAFVEAVRERFIDAVEWEGAEALEEGDDE